MRLNKYSIYRSVYGFLRYVFTGIKPTVWWEIEYKTEIWNPDRTIRIHNEQGGDV